MTILFLHGWTSTPGGIKPIYLRTTATVLNPNLPDEDFPGPSASPKPSSTGKPQVVAGSSRGRAVAMNIDAGTAPLVLLCPAWKRWGGQDGETRHGDPPYPGRRNGSFLGSEELVRNSGLPRNR